MVTGAPGYAAESASGYRKGVILGLTLAETMLLLIFCLLLASAAILMNREEAIRELETQLAVLRPVEAPAPVATEPAQASLTIEPRLVEAVKRLTLVLLDAGVRPEDLPLLAEVTEQIRTAARAADPDAFWRELKVGVALASGEAGLLEQLASIPSSDREELVGISRQVAELDPTQRDALLRLAVQHLDRLDDLARLAEAAGALQASGWTLQEVIDTLVEYKAEGRGPGIHDWPPIIRLSDADGFSFESGSANLTAEFETELQTAVVDKLAAIIDQYDVDVVEVIGHTDEQRLVGRQSNLDDLVLGTLGGAVPPVDLQAGDNAGLGLARAIAVAKAISGDPRLRGKVQILPLSAGQTTMLGDLLADGTASGNVAERRRIEIRVRRKSVEAGEAKAEAAPSEAWPSVPDHQSGPVY